VDDLFEKYFHDRADLADELSRGGYALEASVLATTALDALAEIWVHDFPAEGKALDVEAGGRVSGSIRMARLVKRFAPAEPEAQKVAVVCFAEDWKRHVPAAAATADTLLKPRLGKFRGELPHSHQDVPRAALLAECPAITAGTKIAALVEEYEYAALLYRFYRCPTVHLGGSAKRTHGFTRDEEVMYMPLHPGFTSVSFGPRLVTRWLRAVATGYATTCAAAGVTPAKDLDPGTREEESLRSKWSKV
jgi:hypothetical protein